MPIYKSRLVTQELNVPQPDSGAITWVPLEIVLPAAALVADDILELVDLPIGVAILDYTIIAPQLDSNGTPTLVASIGHKTAVATDLDVVYEAALTPGRTASGNVVRCGNAVAAGQDTSAVRRLALKVTTAAATSATAGKTLRVLAALQG